MKLRLIGLFLSAIVFQNANAQFEFLPLSNESENIYNHQLFPKSTEFHSSVKPYRRSEVNKITSRDSIIESKYYQGKFFNTWLIYIYPIVFFTIYKEEIRTLHIYIL